MDSHLQHNGKEMLLMQFRLPAALNVISRKLQGVPKKSTINSNNNNDNNDNVNNDNND